MFNAFKNKCFLRFFEKPKNRFNSTLKRECGRSMVEMIAVLAIIGLLSSAGVIGYKTAFDTYRATSIMDTVLKGKLAVEADYRVAGEATLIRAMKNGSIPNVENSVSLEPDRPCPHNKGRDCNLFTITTTETASVCEKILLRQSLYNSSDESDNTPEIYITANNGEDCGETGEVLMRFEFYIPMLKAGNGSDLYEPIDPKLKEYACPAGEIVVNGVCQCRYECKREDGNCVCCDAGSGYEYDSETKSCICPAGTHDTGIECVTCSEVQNWDETSKTCICPAGAHKVGSECVTCPEGQNWNEDKKKCIQCLTSSNCDGETPFCDNNICTACPPVTPLWNGTNCMVCPDDKPVWDSEKKECTTCPDAMPVWHTDMKQCVQCLENSDCNDNATPVCNDTNACEPCPDETPIWVAETGKCIASDGSSGYVCNQKAYECHTNEDCALIYGSGYYCDIECYTEYCKSNTTGIAGSCRNASNDLASPAPGTNPPFKKANRFMYMWSANNFCESMGWKLTEVSDYNCTPTICANGCESQSGICYSENNTVSENIVIIAKAYSLFWYWTNTDYDSCNPYVISTSANRILYARDNPKGGVVCKICSGSTPVWNGTNCEACPTETPVWNGTACVSCAEADSTKPYWNEETSQCEVCPDETPIWDAETGKCIASDGPSGEGDDECVTNCRWTGWLDSGKPDYTKTGGDVESLENICEGGYVGDILCRAAGFPNTHLSELGQDVLCNTEVGFVCRNQDQKPGGATHIPSCINYEIAVYCCFKSESCYKCTTSTDCPNEAPYCNNGKCEACPSETPYWDEYQNKCVAEMICEEPACHTNSDCGEGEYCDIACYDDKCTDDATTMNGRCRVAINDIQVPNEGTTPPFIISKREMFWWSAKNFCQALGTTLVDDVDYNCSAPIVDNLACTSDVDSYSVHVKSMIQSYSLKYGGGWTDTSYDSCMVIVMDWLGGAIRRYNKTDPKYAVCKNLDLSCEDGMIWHPDLNKCVECTVNLHCNSDKPNCSLETNTCGLCPAEAPLWNSDERECAKYICKKKSYNCQTNSECADDEYCEISCYTESCTKDASQLYGTCEKVEFETPNSGTNPAFVKSSDPMTWWGANNFCQAQGKVMVTPSDFNCAHTICPSGCDAETGYCHASASQSVSSSAKNDRTQVMQNMYNAYDDSDVWLNSDYDNCESYELSFYTGSIDNGDFYYINYALCKDRPSCPTETPYWDGTECTTCPIETPYWNEETDQCEVCPAETPIWDGTTCIEGYVCKGTTSECQTNSDCNQLYGSGYYCNIECFTDHCSKETTSLGGSCRKAISDVKEPNSGTTPPFVMSSEKMYWWSAKNFCQALGQRLVDVTDYECAHAICPDDNCDNEWGFCHADTSNTVIGGTPSNISAKIAAMKEAYGSYYCWVDMDYNSCRPYFTNFNQGLVTFGYRNNRYYAVCESVCEGDTPVWNGTACVSCAEADSTKPYWNEETSQCEACPDATPIWDGTTCISIAQNCQTAMTSAGFSTANFTMDGTTVKYTGDMTLTKDLDISGCNLDVAGILRVNSGKTLKVNNVKAESSGTHGIDNRGTITATGDVTGTSSGTGVIAEGIENSGTIEATGNVTGTGAYEGIYNDGTITATGDVTGTATGTGAFMGISNYGSGTITATNVKGMGNDYGINNSATITATGDVTGTGNDYGIDNSGTIESKGDVWGAGTWRGIDNRGTITATNVTGTGDYEGINNRGTIEATNVTGTGDDGIYNRGTITATGDVTGMGDSVGIRNPGTITATNVYYCQTISNSGKIIGHIQCKCPEGMSCPATTITQCTAPTPVLSGNLTTCVACAEADSTKPVWNEETSQCEACPTDKPAWSGTECYNEATAQNCQTAMTSAGFDSDDFTMEGSTIKYTGDMTVSTDLDISACNLDVAGMLTVRLESTLKVNNVKAESSRNEGIFIDSGIIEATGNVTGIGSVTGIWSSYGTIEATNVMGISKATGTEDLTGLDTFNYYFGIYIRDVSSITATNVTGTGGSGGISNVLSTITATGDVTGTATGTGSTSYGIFNVGTITATNVYYCPTIENRGTINVTPQYLCSQ